jgi:hypothetical protein
MAKQMMMKNGKYLIIQWYIAGFEQHMGKPIPT